MKKRLLSLLLAVIMIVGLLPVTAMAVGAGLDVSSMPVASGYEYGGGKLLLYGVSTDDTLIVPDGTVIEVVGYSKVGAISGSDFSITGSGVLEVVGSISGDDVTFNCGHVMVGSISADTVLVEHGYISVSGNVAASVTQSGGYLNVVGTVSADLVSLSGGYLETAGVVGDVSNGGGVLKVNTFGIDGDVSASSGVVIVNSSDTAITGTITLNGGEKLFNESNCSELSEIGTSTSVVIAKSALTTKYSEISISDAALDSVYAKANISSGNAMELVGGSYVTGYAKIGNTSSSETRHVSGSGTLVVAKGLHANNYATFTTTGTLIGIAPNNSNSVVAGIRLVYGSYTSGEFIGVSNTNNCAAFRFQSGRSSYNSSKPLYVLSDNVRIVAVSTVRSNAEDALHVNSGSGSGPAFQMNGGSLTCYAKKGNGVEFDHGAEINGGNLSSVGLGSYGYGLTCTGNTLFINGGTIGAYGKSAAMGDTFGYLQKGSTTDDVLLNVASDFGGAFTELSLSTTRQDFEDHTKTVNRGNNKIAYFGELKKAYTLTYDANGGYDDADNTVTTKVETVLEQEDYALLTTSPFVHADVDDVAVVWFGWTEEADSKIYTKNDAVPSTVIETIDIEGNEEVFALWSLDANNNGTADVVEPRYTVTYKAATNTDLDDDVVHSGLLTGEDIPAAPADVTADTGYTLGEWTLTSGEVDASGKIGETDLIYELTVAINKYTVTWVNDDGDILETDEEVPYGTTPSYDSETPSKVEDAQYTYEFAGWDPEVEAVTGDATYTATYTPTLRKYTVTYTDGVDGKVIFKDDVHENVPYGSKTPGFRGVPKRSGYIFIGWEPEVKDTVTGDATYVAQWRLNLSRLPLLGGIDPIVEVEGLNTVDHVAYVVGRGDNKFVPTGTVTRAEAATMLFRLMTDSHRNYYWDNSCTYTDVAGDAWYNVAIATLEAAGVIQDTAAYGKFRPNEPITRAEMAVMAAQFCDVTGTVPHASFYDVAASHWAADEIALMEYAGFIQGFNGYYRPEDTITRAECVTIINRMLERGAEAENMLPTMVTFVDVKPDAWYYEAVQEAANSHTYTRTNWYLTNEFFYGELWLTIEKAPDWAAMEQIWAAANK